MRTSIKLIILADWPIYFRIFATKCSHQTFGKLLNFNISCSHVPAHTLSAINCANRISSGSSTMYTQFMYESRVVIHGRGIISSHLIMVICAVSLKRVKFYVPMLIIVHAACSSYNQKKKKFAPNSGIVQKNPTNFKRVIISNSFHTHIS